VNAGLNFQLKVRAIIRLGLPCRGRVACRTGGCCAVDQGRTDAANLDRSSRVANKPPEMQHARGHARATAITALSMINNYTRRT